MNELPRYPNFESGTSTSSNFGRQFSLDPTLKFAYRPNKSIYLKELDATRGNRKLTQPLGKPNLGMINGSSASQPVFKLYRPGRKVVTMHSNRNGSQTDRGFNTFPKRSRTGLTESDNLLSLNSPQSSSSQRRITPISRGGNASKDNQVQFRGETSPRRRQRDEIPKMFIIAAASDTEDNEPEEIVNTERILLRHDTFSPKSAQQRRQIETQDHQQQQRHVTASLGGKNLKNDRFERPQTQKSNHVHLTDYAAHWREFKAERRRNSQNSLTGRVLSPLGYIKSERLEKQNVRTPLTPKIDVKVKQKTQFQTQGSQSCRTLPKLDILLEETTSHTIDDDGLSPRFETV